MVHRAGTATAWTVFVPRLAWGGQTWAADQDYSQDPLAQSLGDEEAAQTR